MKVKGSDLAGPSLDVQLGRVPWNERPWGVWTIRVVTLAVILTGWELYGRAQNPALFEPPSEVVVVFREIAIEEPILWLALWDSVRTLFIGFFIGIVVGTTVGVLMGRSRTIEYVLDPYVSFLYALPMVVIIPLLIIWLGIGANSRVAIVFAISVVPVLLNTMAGAKQVDENLVEVGMNYEATKRQLLTTVVLPGILPFVFTGINVGIGAAIIGMVLGEILIVIRGLGGLVVEYSNTFQPAKVFVALLALIALSLVLSYALRQARKLLMPWDRVREV